MAALKTWNPQEILMARASEGTRRVTKPLNKNATAVMGKINARNMLIRDGEPRNKSSQNLVTKTETTVMPLKRKQETRLKETNNAFLKRRPNNAVGLLDDEEEKGGCGEA